MSNPEARRHSISSHFDPGYLGFWTMGPCGDPGTTYREHWEDGWKSVRTSTAPAMSGVLIHGEGQKGGLPLMLGWEAKGLTVTHVNGEFRHTTGIREPSSPDEMRSLRRYGCVGGHALQDEAVVTAVKLLTNNDSLNEKHFDTAALMSDQAIEFWSRLMRLELQTDDPKSDRLGVKAGAPYPLPPNFIEYAAFESATDFLAVID